MQQGKFQINTGEKKKKVDQTLEETVESSSLKKPNNN